MPWSCGDIFNMSSLLQNMMTMMTLIRYYPLGSEIFVSRHTTACSTSSLSWFFYLCAAAATCASGTSLHSAVIKLQLKQRKFALIVHLNSLTVGYSWAMIVTFKCRLSRFWSSGWNDDDKNNFSAEIADDPDDPTHFNKCYRLGDCWESCLVTRHNHPPWE